MDNLERVLKEHPFLAGFDDKYIKLLVGCASNVAYKSGEYIFRESEDANHFYFIRNGKIKVETYCPQHGPLIISTCGEGDIVGWSWLVPPYKWHFDAKAVEVTRVITIDGKCLREKCEQDHDLGYEIMKRFALIIAERLEQTRIQLLDIYGNHTKKQ